MDKNIDILIFKNNYSCKDLLKKFVFILSNIICFYICFLIPSAMALTEYESYTLYLKDNYDYSWKKDAFGPVTKYELNLIFMDTNGQIIEGKDVTIEIGPDALADDPYAFGYVPLKNSTTTETRGSDLTETLNLKEYITSTGEKYRFDHAEVYVNGEWQILSDAGTRWHIWCQSASSEILPTSYGWRGNYGENISYTITNDTQYKFVYQLIRYGDDRTVASLENDSGITFKMFNYAGDNDETGINANGIYEYFTFRDSSREKPTKINALLDADGFGTNRTKVLPKLDSEGYPIFNCQGKCSTNPSLGYLFGSKVNPAGVTPVGVTSYNPTNTLLQKETIDEVDYYYYDSSRNAVDYDIDNNRFLVRNYVERAYSMSTYVNEANRYEFIPFNYLTDLENVKTNAITNLNYNYDAKEKDNWYGMTMEFEFYMPRDGMIKDKDMIFSFSGDDDVWVFIDDVLVLDLGGTHGAVDGTINFKTGNVESYLNWNNTVGEVNVTNIYQAYLDANSIDAVKWKEVSIDDGTTKIFDNYTKHTLKFFYLERGAAVANCKIRFNIPVLPTGSLSVQKQFEGTGTFDDTYEFMLYDVTKKSVASNVEYTIGEDKFTTDEFGKFKLKINDIAIFKLINEHKYYVEETDAGIHAVSYKCSFDGLDCLDINKTPEFTMNPESSYQAVFTNRAKPFKLKVSKIAYATEFDEVFDFEIQLKNKDGTVGNIPSDIISSNSYEVDSANGIITYSLKSGEELIINDISIDTVVTVLETNHDGYQTIIKTGDTELANGDTYEFIMDSDKDITFHNTPGVTLPETGGPGILKYLFVALCLILVAFWYQKYYFLGKRVDK